MKYTAPISYVILACFVGIGIGYSITPEYAQMREEKRVVNMDLGKADRYVDLRYIDGMIAHHLAAIHLSEQAKIYSRRPEIIQLASTIIASDREGIAALYARKKEWYGNTRSVAQFEKVQLGTSDTNFDLRFINALIAHHDEAITIAREIQTKSTRNDVLTLASTSIFDLSEGKKILEGWRKDWYGIGK